MADTTNTEMKKECAAPTAAKKKEVVLTHSVWFEGILLPVGTVLDATLPWVVAGVIAPGDLCEPKSVHDARLRVEAEIARIREDAAKDTEG